MTSRLVIFVTVFAVGMGQLCPPGCMQSYGGGCGGCGGIRAYRIPIMRQSYSPCGGSGCGQIMMPMLQNGCNGGGCGGTGQQVAYGIPDPIITESGRIIRAPFLPPPALPPQPVGQNPMVNQLTGQSLNVNQGK